jgi:hypothetical protein
MLTRGKNSVNSEATTNFDVMEEALGFCLSEENHEKVDSLGFAEIQRMATAVWDHVKADYFAVPQFPDDVVGLPYMFSRLGRALGGYVGDGAIGGTVDSLAGSMHAALLTQDRLMLPDGLQYILDYYAYAPAPPNGHERFERQIKKILHAYASLRDLFVSRQLVILPDSVSIQVRDSTRWTRDVFSEPVIKAIAESPYIQNHIAAPEVRGKIKEQAEKRYPGYPEDGGLAMFDAWLLTIHMGHGLTNLLAVAREYGYAPILDGPILQTMFDGILRAGSTRTGRTPIAYSQTEAGDLIPYLGRLPLKEFMALKRSGNANDVARTLARLDRQSLDLRDRPLELQQMLQSELHDAVGKLGKTISGSAVLKHCVSGVRKVVIGAITGPAVAVGAGHSEWIGDPYKMIMMSCAGAATGVISEVVDMIHTSRKTAAPRRVYTKLAEELAEGTGPKLGD